APPAPGPARRAERRGDGAGDEDHSGEDLRRRLVPGGPAGDPARGRVLVRVGDPAVPAGLRRVLRQARRLAAPDRPAPRRLRGAAGGLQFSCICRAAAAEAAAAGRPRPPDGRGRRAARVSRYWRRSSAPAKVSSPGVMIWALATFTEWSRPSMLRT